MGRIDLVQTQVPYLTNKDTVLFELFREDGVEKGVTAGVEGEEEDREDLCLLE